MRWLAERVELAVQLCSYLTQPTHPTAQFACHRLDWAQPYAHIPLTCIDCLALTYVL